MRFFVFCVLCFLLFAKLTEGLIDRLIFLRGSGEARAAQAPPALAVPRAPSHPLAFFLSLRDEIPLPLPYGCDVFPSQGTVCTYRCVRLLLRLYSNRGNG